MIQKQTGIWYFVYHDRGRQRWKSLKTKDKRSATQIYNRLLVKLDSIKTGVAPRKLTVESAIETYLEAKQATLKPRTLEQYKQQAKTVLKTLPVEYVNKITRRDLDDYVTTRRRSGVSPKTIKEELSTLKAALAQSRRDGLLSELPVSDWPTFKIAPVTPDRLGHYSLADIEILKKHFQGRSFEPVFLFALYTGCRRGEMESLKVSDINLAENAIRIRSAKTESNAANQFRHVPIHPGLVPSLELITHGRARSAPLFPILVSNYHNYPAKVMLRACKKTGVEYKRFHGLRHTTATYLLAAGVPLRDVMAIMGWTRLETAQRYIHMANAAASQVAKLPY